MSAPLRGLLLPAVLATVLMSAAACGQPPGRGTGSASTSSEVQPSDSAKQQLQRAISRLTSSSFSMDGNLKTSSSNQSFTANVTVHADVASFGAVAGKVSGTSAGSNLDSEVVLAQSGMTPSASYESTDGGKTWTKKPTITTADTYLETPLEYVLSASTVADQGQAKVNGTATELYHATLTGTTFLSSIVMAEAKQATLNLNTASMDVYVDGKGNIIKVASTADASGGPVLYHQTMTCTFSGWGSKLTITPPPAVS